EWPTATNPIGPVLFLAGLCAKRRATVGCEGAKCRPAHLRTSLRRPNAPSDCTCASVLMNCIGQWYLCRYRRVAGNLSLEVDVRLSGKRNRKSKSSPYDVRRTLYPINLLIWALGGSAK